MWNTQADPDSRSEAFQKMVRASQKLLLMRLYSDAGVMDVERSDLDVQLKEVRAAMDTFLTLCTPSEESPSEMV